MLIIKSHLKRMQRANPLFKNKDVIFDKVDNTFQILYDVTTGDAAIKIFGEIGAPFKFEVLDVVLQPRGASTAGTMKLTDGTNDITDAMVCAVDKTMVRVGTIDNDYSKIEKGGNLQIVCGGSVVASTIGLVTVLAREVE